GQQLQCPAPATIGSLRASFSYQPCLGFAVEPGFVAGARLFVDGVQTGLDKAFANALYGSNTDLESRDNLIIREAVGGFQQNPCAGEFAGGGLAAADQQLELLALIYAQIDKVLFLWHLWSSP